MKLKLSSVIAERSGKTIYRDGKYMIKVFENSYSKADVLNEALNQARVEETGLNIPKLHEVTVMDGKWTLVSDFIEGTTLSDLIKKSKSAEKINGYLDLFVTVQTEIHSRRSPLLTLLHDKMKRKIDQTELDATTRYELHTRLDALPVHRKVCHGDFSPDNVIITDGNVPYVIDWAHATQGNASADAARTYLRFWLDGQKDLAAHYISLFSKKSDTARQYIEKWLPIVAASQSVKGKPRERDFLLSWVNVVDYE